MVGFNDHKIHLCINTGRCGSDYLTDYYLRQERCEHEGVPVMNGSPMQKFNAGDDSELRELMP